MNSFLAIHHLRAHKKNEKNSENVGKTMIFKFKWFREIQRHNNLEKS